MDTLKDVYTQQLRDIYSSNEQTLALVPEMQKLASDDRLKKALDKTTSIVRQQNEAIAAIVKKHGADPKGEFCKGTQGLVNEAKDDTGEAKEGPVRDAVIIASMQRISHYAIAGYGTCKALAKQLGTGDDSDLAQCVARAAEGDETFTTIAEENVNPSA
ncbi:MAG: DUF892 family protein [Geminicoccaceae bacterium]|nr:DUF892 family protein [Geminicoccaceae bacterium]